MGDPCEPLLRCNLKLGPNYCGFDSIDPLVKVYFKPGDEIHQRLTVERFEVSEFLQAYLPREVPHLWKDWHRHIFASFWHTYKMMTLERVSLGALSDEEEEEEEEDEDKKELEEARRFREEAEGCLLDGDVDMHKKFGFQKVHQLPVFIVLLLRLYVGQSFLDYAIEKEREEEKDIFSSKWKNLRMNLLMFMEQHILAAAYFQDPSREFESDERVIADIDFKAPDDTRIPWYGQLPSLTRYLMNMGNVHRVRHSSKGELLHRLVHMLVDKMCNNRCMIRNIHTIVMQECSSNSQVMDLIMDIMMVMLLGNLPEAKYHMSFRTRVFVVTNFLLMLNKSNEGMAEWFTFNARLVFFTLKSFMLLNLDNLPTARASLHTYRNYEPYTKLVYGIMDEVRARLDAKDWTECMPQHLERKALLVQIAENEDEALRQAEEMEGKYGEVRQMLVDFKKRIEYIHNKCNKGASKLRKTGANRKMASGMMLQLNTVEFVLAVGLDFYRERVRLLREVNIPVARFYTDLRNVVYALQDLKEPEVLGEKATKFLMNNKTGVHPFLPQEKLDAIYAAAAAAVVEPSGWPHFEYLMALGVSEPMIEQLCTIYIGFDGADTPDYQSRKSNGKAFCMNPYEYCIAQVYFAKMVAISAVQIDVVSYDFAMAQEQAVRRRYHIKPDQEITNEADFVYCRGCLRCYNDLLYPEKANAIGSQSVGLKPGVTSCVYDPYQDAFCCGKKSTPMCSMPLIRVNGIGRSFFIAPIGRVQICGRCGCYTTYDPMRLTTHGVICGCEVSTRPKEPKFQFVDPRISGLPVLKECDAAMRHHFITTYNTKKWNACVHCQALISPKEQAEVLVHDSKAELGPKPHIATVFVCKEHQAGLAKCRQDMRNPMGVIQLECLHRYMTAMEAARYRFDAFRSALAELEGAK